MKILVISLVIILAACSAATPSTQSNVIIADGTEVQQFEAMFFCSDKEGFIVALGDVGSHLGAAWDTVMGESNKAECTVRININATGEILGHEIVSCEDTTKVDEVLGLASPVPVPNNECLLQKVNGVKYTLNSNEEKS